MRKIFLFTLVFLFSLYFVGEVKAASCTCEVTLNFGTCSNIVGQKNILENSSPTTVGGILQEIVENYESNHSNCSGDQSFLEVVEVVSKDNCDRFVNTDVDGDNQYTISCVAGVSNLPAAPEVVSKPNTADKKTISLQNPINLKLGKDEKESDILLYLVGNIINKALGILGSITLLVFIYGGFMWLVSAGSPEKITKGKDSMLWAAIGVFIIFASYAILGLVIEALAGK